ncbi:hypothetical protein FQA39_LY04051 [Lamprigera yunnana]|nr:hypothetical protein FQA39_LY04051 [Lamprigera yunnana]
MPKMILSAVPSVLKDNVRELVPTSKILVVGAGGIGCEILKNLALSGFNDIEVIDLDTIDVSNLNRQFLFRKEHVGKSKSQVAKESILNYNPNISIIAYHDSITSQEYGVNFFKRFKIVLNALDNRAARNHVNRMCLAADIPLIESGTAGYSGQVEFIKKGVTQCYECRPKPPQKTFPGCTIRNTPSEPVHCIVWAKHLFNQLFGEEDADQDVSPDTADPEAVGSAGANAMKSVTESGDVERTSTRQWAQNIDYNAIKLFNKFFQDDIKYLLSMVDLWVTRKAPTPLSWEQATCQESGEEKGEVTNDSVHTTDMQIWPLHVCAETFESTIKLLKEQLSKKDFLIWDKDNKVALDFVTACTNIRAHIFSIAQKSRFDIKSIAGNIIPAIATTNAMIAGLVVLIAFRALAGDYDQCQYIYLRPKSIHTTIILAPEKSLQQANPECYVCAKEPYVTLYINLEQMTVKEFESEVLQKTLNMIAPDVMLDSKGICILSSDEEDADMNKEKKLLELGVTDGTILKADDFLQNYSLTIGISQYVADVDEALFRIDSGNVELKPQENGKPNGSLKDSEVMATTVDIEDGLIVNTTDTVTNSEEDPQEGTSSKRRKLNTSNEVQQEDDDDDDLVMLDDP